MKVLCANDNGNWKWLHEYGNIFKHVKVEGNIVQKEQTISLLNRYFTYFKVKGTESDLEALK
ncbi:hypothetical protein [Pigmentibacter ruber]|uniref:hypothetical protein n=1 Tax=Pigmentibacter ruber TaxID=2683196 RepID=UPI00131CB3FB|nr:hypothetical protein [Pigmentibacter ruber]